MILKPYQRLFESAFEVYRIEIKRDGKKDYSGLQSYYGEFLDDLGLVVPKEDVFKGKNLVWFFTPAGYKKYGIKIVDDFTYGEDYSVGDEYVNDSGDTLKVYKQSIPKDKVVYSDKYQMAVEK